jgi:hypothetical protein
MYNKGGNNVNDLSPTQLPIKGQRKRFLDDSATDYFTKTIAFKGDLKLGYIREKENHSKYQILERFVKA